MKNVPKIILLSFIILFAAVLPVFAQGTENTPVEVDVNIVANGNALVFDRPLLSAGGRILVPAGDVFGELGAKVDWYPKWGQINVFMGNKYINMKTGSTKAIADGKFLTMDTPPLLVDGTVMLPVRFVAEELGIEVKWDNKTKTVFLGKSSSGKTVSRNWSRTPVVVIDPGHGGKMSGAVYSGIMEKDLNLDIARRLNTLLREQGIETYMTRNDDRHVDLYDRSGLANSLNADLFVSIHNNAGSSSMSGSMTLYYPGGSGFTSKTFAKVMQEELVKNLGTKDLGIIPRPNLAVLRTTKMPAVLVEVAFMTNSSDMQKLKTSDFRQAAAEAIRDGIIKALNSK